MKRAAFLFLLASAPVLAAEAPTPFALRDGDRVVFYGDSITQDGAYARFVEEYVRTRFPQWDIRFYNAGVGGDTVKGGGAGPIDVRLERDVIALKPTVVTIMLGMNDGGYKPFDPMTLATFGEGYRAIVAKLRQALPGARLTFIRSSPFDDVARPPQFLPGYDDTLRRLGCYVTTLGAKEKATVVDFREPVNAGIAAVMTDNPDLARQIVPDRVHPGPAGHLVMGATLLRAWSAPALVAKVAIDAATRTVTAAENAEVGELAATDSGLSWTGLDRALPLPLAFEDGETELAERAGAGIGGLDQQTMVVTGLDGGRYELKIDGQSVGTFADVDLARGVNLARYRTPMRWQAYSVKWSVGSGHEAQRLRRDMLVDGAKDPSLQATADILAARDESAQKRRSVDATPKPRRYELTRVP